MARRKHNDAHAGETNRDTDPIPPRWAHSINQPKPDNRDANIYPAISGIDAPSVDPT
jgi:hypothetical protein